MYVHMHEIKHCTIRMAHCSLCMYSMYICTHVRMYVRMFMGEQNPDVCSLLIELQLTYILRVSMCVWSMVVSSVLFVGMCVRAHMCMNSTCANYHLEKLTFMHMYICASF